MENKIPVEMHEALENMYHILLQAAELVKGRKDYLKARHRIALASGINDDREPMQLILELNMNAETFYNDGDLVSVFDTPHDGPAFANFITPEVKEIHERRDAIIASLQPGKKITGPFLKDVIATIDKLDEPANKLYVVCSLGEGTSDWNETWNLQHTIWGFERGEYEFVIEPIKP